MAIVMTAEETALEAPGRFRRVPLGPLLLRVALVGALLYLTLPLLVRRYRNVPYSVVVKGQQIEPSALSDVP